MLGTIIGDIAGSSYEVDEINSLRKKEINYSNRIKILDRNVPLFNNNSSYTDDTILTCAVANSVMTDKDYYKNLKEFGLRELSYGLDRYGRNRFGSGFCDWLNGDYIGESYGNGCAMRISPIANYYDDLDKISYETKQATYPTHNNKEAYDMSILVSVAIYLVKLKANKNYIKHILETYYKCNLNFNLEDLQRNYKFTSRASDSVPQAIFCFLVSNDFEDAIRKAISIGGDSDTIASITGAIAEVYYGIDKKLIEKVEKFLPEYIINITNNFYNLIGKEKPFKNEIKDFFKSVGLYNEEFFDYMKGKVTIIPSGSSLEWASCFPKIENEILKDIHIIVPKIKTEKDLLVNIHEYTHARELYDELGSIYEDRVEERENKAKEMENVYIKRKSVKK